MTTCRAAVVTTYGEGLDIQDVPIPSIEDGGILVKVEAATLCGTDVHLWEGTFRDAYPELIPYIPGHETCGAIVAIGRRRTDVVGRTLEVGDRVVANFAYCGSCYYCTIAGQPVLCTNVKAYGRNRSDRFPHLLGGCADYHYFHPGAALTRVPEGVSAPLASSSSCALRTIMHAFETIGSVGSHETVLVQGAGPVGLYAAAVARDRGARQVLMIGAPAARLELARAFGADDVLDVVSVSAPGDRKEWLLELTDGRGADVVLQCASTEAIPEAFELVRPGGRLVSIGVSSGTITLPGSVLSQKYLQVRGITGGGDTRHSYEALDFLATHRALPFERMITGTYPLEGVAHALRAMSELREIKAVVVP